MSGKLWKHDSSGRAPAYKHEILSLNPNTSKKKKKAWAEKVKDRIT
jgi:hypothetical protein